MGGSEEGKEWEGGGEKVSEVGEESESEGGRRESEIGWGG